MTIIIVNQKIIDNVPVNCEIYCDKVGIINKFRSLEFKYLKLY